MLRGTTAVFAEQLFPNAIPFVDIADPQNPIFRAIIDISFLGDYAGTGIDIDQQNVYVTGEVYVVGSDYGSSGSTALMIAQYNRTVDNNGVAPTVSIVSPTAADTLIAGERRTITADATDDVGVDHVNITIDGQNAGTVRAPYAVTARIPTGVSSVLIGATATDFGGNVGTAAPVQVNVIPDPLTTVKGVVLRDTGGASGARKGGVAVEGGAPFEPVPVEGATVQVGSRSTTTDAEGEYVLTGAPTVDGDFTVTATALIDGLPYRGTSEPVAPVRGGETIVPNIFINAVGTGIVASLPLERAVDEVDVANDLAVLVGSEGLQIVNVANPLAPFVVAEGALEGSPRDVKLFNGHAYIAADDASLLVYDVSNPASPALVGTVPNSNGTRALDLTGATLCAAAGAGGLQIWSLADPASPQLAGSFSLPRPILKVACRGSLAAVVQEGVPSQYGGGSNTSVTLLDISNTAAPAVLANVNLSGDPHALELTAQHLWALSSQTMMIWDITDPSAPVETGSSLAGFGSTDFASNNTHIFTCGSRGAQPTLKTNPAKATNGRVGANEGPPAGDAIAAVAELTEGLPLLDVFWSDDNAYAVALKPPYAVLVGRDLEGTPILHMLLYLSPQGPPPSDVKSAPRK